MDAITESVSQILNEDLRASLVQWANNSDGWIRRIVRHVLTSNDQIADVERARMYRQFREEKGIGKYPLSHEPKIIECVVPLAKPESLYLTGISNVKGVNALAEGERIDFGLGLTLLFGENGTGKTGYARILKRIAGSRSANEILPNVNLQADQPAPSADIDYRLGEADLSHQWNGEQAQAPFTLMSLFDNTSAHFHVDSDLQYTYRPGSLALFDRVNHEIQSIGDLVEEERQSLGFGKSALLKRFDSCSSIYPYVESLGPETNLSELQQFLNLPDNAVEQKDELESKIAVLRANVVGKQLAITSRYRDILAEAFAYSEVARKFEVQKYNSTVTELVDLRSHERLLRDDLFANVSLPAERDETWGAFIHAGNEHRMELESLGAHDATYCLYCRQPLNTDGLELIAKYRDYLESQIARDIQAQETTIQNLIEPFEELSLATVDNLVGGPDTSDEGETLASSDQKEALRSLVKLAAKLRQQFKAKAIIDEDILSDILGSSGKIEFWLSGFTAECDTLRAQEPDQGSTLVEKQSELLELEARLKLEESWEDIERFVANTNRYKKLGVERTAITNILRQVTILSNKASERLINNNFETMFRHECAELRAPALELEFIGRQGSAQRRKRLPGELSPSSVLSEGEQNVIAIADFMAEVRMSENSVPVVFDDPVSSLDHRRVKEVASRIANLASDHQVVVFTHDIFFTACLLDTLENSERCVYYRITDEDGKGTVTPGTGPRWDTIKNLAAKVDKCIRDAKNAEGEIREAHVRDAYGSIRSWCEVFVEQDVLAKVTERFQPNVRMTSLRRIKVAKLEETIETVTSVFENACRYIEAHSQALHSLGVAPNLSDLEDDWDKLRKCRREYLK